MYNLCCMGYVDSRGSQAACEVHNKRCSSVICSVGPNFWLDSITSLENIASWLSIWPYRISCKIIGSVWDELCTCNHWDRRSEHCISDMAVLCQGQEMKGMMSYPGRDVWTLSGGVRKHGRCLRRQWKLDFIHSSFEQCCEGKWRIKCTLFFSLNKLLTSKKKSRMLEIDWIFREETSKRK